MLGDFRNLANQGYINSRYKVVTDYETARAISTRWAVMMYAGSRVLQQIESLSPQIHLSFFFLPGKSGTVYVTDDRSMQWGISSLTTGNGKKIDACARLLQLCYPVGIYEAMLEIINGSSVTVRRVNMSNIPNKKIMGATYEGNPVYTKFPLEGAQPLDGFVECCDRTLAEALWGGTSISSLTDNVLGRREEP